MIFNDATRAQIDAARPDASTWLTANAGSGKTRVLTDRVARLLLNGVSPQNILCLTYTTAAASEMQNRLFKRLGAWAMLDDASLRTALQELGVDKDLSPPDLRQARTLFALAIEAPGGLKIQTIHSFCAALLRRFPLEASVSPQFTEIEDRAAELLRADIVDQMADGPEASTVQDMARLSSEQDFNALTATIARQRDQFSCDVDLGDMLTALEQPATLTATEIESSVFLGDEQTLIQRILPHLTNRGGNDLKAAEKLKQIRAFDLSALPMLESVFLTGAGAKNPFSAKLSTFPTKDTKKVIADDLDALQEFMQRVEVARMSRLALECAQNSLVLQRFAKAFLDRYATAKQMRGWLDFDDLILKARDLLSDPATAAWVLYRIDGGISHVLVDEAQDTSPRQWDVIEALTAEFHSGEGVRDQDDRTLFVVGDKKQSIYSFQGADPKSFDLKAEAFGALFTAAQKPFQHRSLEYSFRSSSAILRSVDTAFDPDRRIGFDRDALHKAFKEHLPGRVDLWPVVPKPDSEPETDWTDPVDRVSARHQDVILAEQIADHIAELTRGEHFIPDEADGGAIAKRRITPGDFLILVQRRHRLFAEIIRACKARELPIAGADKLKVGAELAVKDLTALLSFLATPDDDLALATALKSPLFGWDEQALYALAQGRPKGRLLWQEVRQAQQAHPETLAVLMDLRGQVDFLRPYDLIERILTRHAGRARLLSRLGAEAEDGIDALLSQALSYERTSVPSLTGFIEWLRTDDLEIKRKIDSASDQIRVMTVHGAKGLEAPIVILPETGNRPVRINDQIIPVGGQPIWKPKSADVFGPISDQLQSMRDDQEAERLRLLYVAMTRAEKWLIVAAAGDEEDVAKGWYGIVDETLDLLNAPTDEHTGIRRFEEGNWHDQPLLSKPPKQSNQVQLEPYFSTPIPLYPLAEAVLSPSDLGGAKVVGGSGEDDLEKALAFGSAVHQLLEVLPALPAAERAPAAQRMAHAALPEDAERAVKQAMAILSDPVLEKLFDGGALAEVPLTAEIGGRRLHGIIDLLIVAENKVTAIDFKSNRVVPGTAAACPEGILRQMGAYALMLAEVYPAKTIETAILWTQAPSLMHLPPSLTLEALARCGDLDVPLSHP